MAEDAHIFEELEQDYSCFSLQIEGVPIWERIRFDVYRQIQTKKGSGQAQAKNEDSVRNYIYGAGQWLRNWIYKNPFFANKHECLFVGHQRRKLEDDGYWWDLYCDPIYTELDENYIHLEFPYLMSHLTPAKTKNIRYLDLLHYAGIIQQKLGLCKPSIDAETQKVIRDIESAIEDQFEVLIDIESLVIDELHERNTILSLYKRLLTSVDPDIVVLVVSYGKETFIEACKSMDIPVVELQHGVIYDHHYGYSYPNPHTKETFPDYLLTFGEFWKESAEYPIPDDCIIPVGYPYLEQTISRYDDIETKDQLVFISQGTIGEQLSKFAIEVDQHPEIEYEIIYKLHPGEYDRWETDYPWLLEADFTVIGDSERQLYELFAESRAQIGVGSTAVYEGLAFGLETYVYDCPGSKVLQPLIDEGSAVSISSVEELLSSIGSSEGTFDREYYFAPNATERACDVITQLIKESQQ